MKRYLLKEKRVISIITVCIMLMLTGCGDPMPDLSAEDSALVAEYAAGILLKHNKNYSGKIVNDDVIAAQLLQEKEFEENTEKYRRTIEKSTETEEQESATADSRHKSNMTMEELSQFLGITPVNLAYDGYVICDSYPDESSPEDVIVAFTAPPGRKLCILKFTLTNQSGEDAVVNIFDARYKFSVIINESRIEQVQATYALEDLAVYKDSILAGESREAVLILDLSAETAAGIGSLALSVNGSEGSAKIALQ